MLTEIRLSNFKCFREATVKPKLVTIFIGANGTGKSSCVQALILLKQSCGEQKLVVNGEYLDLGNYGDIVYSGSTKRSVKIGISGAVIKEPPVEFPFDTSIVYTNNIQFLEGRVVTQECHIKSGIDIRSEYSHVSPKLSPPKIELLGVINQLKTSSEIGRPVVSTIQSITSEDARKNTELSAQIVEAVLDVVRRRLQSIFLIPAIRGFDAYSYPLEDSPVIDFAITGGVAAHAQLLASILAYKRELEDIISTWFRRITGISVSVKLQEQKRVSIEGGIAKTKFNIVNEGFGSNQLTFALMRLATSPEQSIICYEEPEIHLHPKAQSELANVLVEVAKQESKQMILTTHSEHILYSLLSNVAEGKLSPEELAIWYFSRKNGEVEKPEELVVDEKGRIEGGLRGFFEMELEQFKRYFKALQKEE